MYKYNNKILNEKVKYVNRKFPITAFIKITSKCMLKCKFCSQGNSSNKEISLENIKTILKKLKREGVLRIFYTGGEPFLHSKFLEIVKFANELGFCQLVITNGYLLNNSKSKEILRYLNGVSVSLHGSESYHNKIVNNKNSYKLAISGIEMLKKEFPQIVLDICYTATSENSDMDNLYDVAKICKSYDLQLVVTRAYNIGNEALRNHNFDYIDELIKNIGELLNKKYNIKIGHCLVPCSVSQKYKHLTSECTAGIDFFAIDMNGDVKICSNSNQKIGNIFNDSFKKIWSHNCYILNKRLNNLSIICKNCNAYNNCIGGCKCETNKVIDGSVDLLYKYVIEKDWKKIKNNHFTPNIAVIKHIGLDKILLIGEKNCLINKKAFKEIKKIDFSKTLYENQKLLNIDIELLLILFYDGFIKVKCDEKIYYK